MSNNYTVYCHINKHNAKRYFGITSQEHSRRWRQNGEGYKNQQYFYRAILKYGWDSFEHEVLYNNLTKKEACEKEQVLIQQYQTFLPKYGYNLTLGGETPSQAFIEAAKKAAEKRKGVPLSENVKKKISSSNKKVIHTIEWNKKISEAKKGVPLSLQHREKLSEAKKGKKISNETKIKMRNKGTSKQVRCIETGIIYPSAEEAARQIQGPSAQMIRAVCNGYRKTTYKYHWVWEENHEQLS